MEDLVTWGLHQGRPGAPFAALVPDHQTILARVLEKKGFIPTGGYYLMVKSTAARGEGAGAGPGEGIAIFGWGVERRYAEVHR